MSKVVENNNQNKSTTRRTKYQVLHDLLSNVIDKKITIDDAVSRLSLRQRPRRPYFFTNRNGKVSLTGYTNYNISLFPEQWENLRILLDSKYYKKFLEKHLEKVSQNSSVQSNYKQNNTNVAK